MPLEPFYFRTWVERYHVKGEDLGSIPRSTPRTAATTASRRSTRTGDGREELLRAEDVQPLLALPVHAGLPGRRDVREPGRRRARRQATASAAATASRPALTAAATSTRRRTPSTSAASATTGSRQGADHRLLRDLPDGRAQARRPQGPERPDPRFPARERRSRCSSRRWPRARRPTTTASTARSGKERAMERRPHRRPGLHVPERDGAPVEHPDRPLPVPHRARRRGVHPRLARAGLQRRGGEADLPARPPDRARVSSSSRRCRCSSTSATRSGPSRCT